MQPLIEKLSPLVMLYILFSFSLPLLAGEPNVMDWNRSACNADIKRYCGDIKPGEGRIPACLKAHDDKISQPCKKELMIMGKETRDKIHAFHKACGADIQKFCGNVRAGGGRIKDCLRQHKNDLSEACQNEANRFFEGRGTASLPE